MYWFKAVRRNNQRALRRMVWFTHAAQHAIAHLRAKEMNGNFYEANLRTILSEDIGLGHIKEVGESSIFLNSLRKFTQPMVQKLIGVGYLVR